MKIRHTQNKSAAAPKGRGSPAFVRLMVSVGLFLLAFGGKTLLPQVTEPVFRLVEEVIETELDLNGIALQVGAFLQGEGDGSEVFRQVFGVSAESLAVSPTVSPHCLSELEWLGLKTDRLADLSHYLPRWDLRDAPGWLP